jgi:hypothetical protein
MAPPTQEKTEGLAALWLPDQGDRAAIPPLCRTEEGSPMERPGSLLFSQSQANCTRELRIFDGLHLALAAEESHKGLSLFVGLTIIGWQPSCLPHNVFNNKVLNCVRYAGATHNMHDIHEDLRE